MASYRTQGVPPKPPTKRRRANKPKSYGAATPTTAPAAAATPRELGIDDPHPLIVSLWNAVHVSCENAFYSDTDWQRLRLELWHANREMASGRPSANEWSAIQSGLNEMLLSPAVKRRAGIEVKPPQGADGDVMAADRILDGYKRTLKSV